jgi:hypothetical protein
MSSEYNYILFQSCKALFETSYIRTPFKVCPLQLAHHKFSVLQSIRAISEITQSANNVVRLLSLLLRIRDISDSNCDPGTAIPTEAFRGLL